MREERVIGRCDVKTAWRLLEDGIKRLTIERDSDRTSPPQLSGPPPNPETPPSRAEGTAAARARQQGHEQSRY